MVANKSERKNDPKKVDSMIGWLILIGFGGVVFVALCQNIGPYSSMMTAALQSFGIFRWIPFLRGHPGLSARGAHPGSGAVG